MILLVVICALVVLLSIVGLVWDFASGLLRSGVDGLMLLLVCLLMGAVFGWQGYVLVESAGWLKNLKFLHRQAASPAAAESTAGEEK